MTVPTPTDLAARTADRRASADLITRHLAPGVLVGREEFRPVHTRAVRESALTPHCRLVALALASYAHFRTGEMSHQPRLAGLVTATGLTPGQVAVALNILTQRGWASRTGSRAYEDADLQPHIPAGALARHRARRIAERAEREHLASA
ncbi:hypothetical protein [Streptomyces sp. NPDC060198]|uniref:hypothetical protein n=1 Tax=Streptomyces sp. NPDC060198 TaxID=3347070 RepID=UPI00365175B0